MNLVILWTNPAADLCVTIPAPSARMPGETDLQFAERIASAVVPAGTATRIVSRSTLPTSRRLRNAWKLIDGTAKPEPVAAKKQLLAELREERNAKLTASDGDFTRLMETGTQQQKDSLKTYRQKLRDLPTTEQTRLDAMTTTEMETYQPNWPIHPGV